MDLTLFYFILLLKIVACLPFRKTDPGKTITDNRLVDVNRAHKFDQGQHQRIRRATVRSRDKLWQRGVLHYSWDTDINKKSKRVIKEAMQHISENSCVRFKKAKSETKDYVLFKSEPGCISEIGRRGGVQNLTIGRGCNKWMGVAVHEILHALGFYHEQARPDRDRYVDVKIENAGEKYHVNFEKLNRTVINSRGFPYDYLSIMHYKQYSFSNTGDETILVKGPGEKLKFPIGQRLGMSNIDIAQLRDMYHCNKKQDVAETECQSGWIKHKTSCYKFVKNPKHQFEAALNYCDKLDSQLVHINTRNEDKFLKKYLSKNIPHIQRWRIGAKKINGTFYWIKRDKTVAEIKYNGLEGESLPNLSTIVLQKNAQSTQFEWQGARSGTSRQNLKFAYAFICEKRAERSCLPALQHTDGRDYRGTLDHTVDGITCQTWTQQYPHRHPVLPDGQNMDSNDGIGEHNYCRNPSTLRRERPWCYTTKTRTVWQYCDVRSCHQPRNG